MNDSTPAGLIATTRQLGDDRALIVAALPPADATGEVAAAWARRAEAMLTGTCACGARMELPNRAERRRARRERRPVHSRFLHEADCGASDDGIRRLTAASRS